MSMGNLNDAWRAFSTVQQLQPGEPMSQQMLAMLQNMRAAMPPAMPTWGALQPPWMAPAGQAPAAGGWQPRGMPGTPNTSQHADWMKTVGEACSMLDKVFKTVGGFQDMVGKFE